VVAQAHRRVDGASEVAVLFHKQIVHCGEPLWLSGKVVKMRK
jgi:hypothetical protein